MLKNLNLAQRLKMPVNFKHRSVCSLNGRIGIPALVNVYRFTQIKSLVVSSYFPSQLRIFSDTQNTETAFSSVNLLE